MPITRQRHPIIHANTYKVQYTSHNISVRSGTHIPYFTIHGNQNSRAHYRHNHLSSPPIHAHSNTHPITIAFHIYHHHTINTNENSSAYSMTQPTHHPCKFMHILIHNDHAINTTQNSCAHYRHNHTSSTPIHAHSNTQSINITILLGTHISYSYHQHEIRTAAPIL